MSIFSWLQRISGFGLEPEPRPRPADWNKTLADLDAEKRSLSGEEIGWAREYEREQLRSWARFPQNDELFEAILDAKVSYMIDWRAPYATGGEGVLPKGTQIRVSVMAGDLEPLAVHALPVDVKQVEQLLIPEDDRNSTKYGGYDLVVRVAQLNKDFRLLASPETA
jgi:hypothetical protein